MDHAHTECPCLLGRLTHRLVPARCLPSDVLYHWPVHLVSNGITEKRGATSVTHPPGRLNRPASWNRAEGSPINGNWPQTTCVPCSSHPWPSQFAGRRSALFITTIAPIYKAGLCSRLFSDL
ncbi:hypothetical protein P8C59_007069 [Phyllachora maydis]|uniref:Uncharacterized protein n=1 Tax=Phyllachora maydis TaxID=1825666 RepID=A0AAD9I9I3_9PEZI|nr:hypothetical protein P8C59_007069 [Phyllachora maydis]